MKIPFHRARQRKASRSERPWPQVLRVHETGLRRDPPHKEIRLRQGYGGQVVVVRGGESEGQAMIDDTINDGKTVAGGGKDVVLAGRYHIIRQLG